MRRAVSLILLGLGVFSVATAVLLPAYVYPQLAKVPLDQKSTATLEGTASRVLAVTNPGSGPVSQIRQNVNLTATAKVQPNFSRAEMKADGDYAVWLLAVQVIDNRDKTVLNASKRQVCFNRRTSEGYVAPAGQTDGPCQADSSYVATVADKAAEPNTTPPEVDTPKAQPGLNFKFPFGVEKKDYDVYDDNTGRPVTANFSGTDTVNGVDVYKFVQKIQDTQTATPQVPGSLVGSEQPSVAAPLFFSGTVTTWVEPVTGIEVKQEQQLHQELRPRDSTPTVVFDGTLTFDAKTVGDLVDQVNANRGQLLFLTETGPIGFGIGGGLLIVIGLVLLIRDRRAERLLPEEEYPVSRHAYANDR